MISELRKPMRIDALLDGFASVESLASVSGDVEVCGVCLDSRLLTSGDVYLAMAGGTTHGMRFAQSAVSNGARAVVTDSAGMRQFADDISALQAANTPVVLVPELKQHAGDIASRFFAEPSKSVQIVAVTGTDGKTSVCRFIANALNGSGHPCGYIGTLGWGLDVLEATELTTPDAATLQKNIAALRDAGARVVVLEASSHGLAEGRLNAVDVDVAVLTNFGRDHLDYHKDLESYKAAKASLFEWPGINSIVVNGADELGAELAKDFASKKAVTTIVFYAAPDAVSADDASNDIEIFAQNIEPHQSGIRFGLVDNGLYFEQSSELMGIFNVENMLACHGVLRALGRAANDASASLEHVQQVAGRMEQFHQRGKPSAVVDFAHTPQALRAAIKAAKHHCDGQLWVVFGCGGDRDAGKRAPMGVAAELADHVIVTDDNPRTENAANIRDQIVAGMAEPARALVIADRATAIEHALQQAATNDLVLIAGKGHEAYQIVGTSVIDYSDRDVVRKLLQEAC